MRDPWGMGLGGEGKWATGVVWGCGAGGEWRGGVKRRVVAWGGRGMVWGGVGGGEVVGGGGMGEGVEVLDAGGEGGIFCWVVAIVMMMLEDE